MVAQGQIAPGGNRSVTVAGSGTRLDGLVVHAETLYGSCPRWIAEEAEKRTYDLYLVTDVDVPWVKDSVRYLPNNRQLFLDRCIRALEERSCRYVRLSGNWDERLKRACSAVEELVRDREDCRDMSFLKREGRGAG